MNRHQMKSCCASAIRQLLKYEGIDPELIFNNIYYTGTRTLKVYHATLKRCDVDIPKLKDRITDIAEAFNFDVRFKTTGGSYWRSGAFIIKL